MLSLLERVRALIAEKPAVLGALAIVPLAMAAQRAEAVVAANPYSFSSGTIKLHSTTSGDATIPGTLGATGVNPLRLNTSSPVTISGETFESIGSGPSLQLTWQGNLGTTFFPMNASQIDIHYDFIIGLGGTSPGSVTWALKDNIGGDMLNASSTSAVTGASTEITGDLFVPVTTALTSTWSSQLDLMWTGFTADGQLTISVPASSSVDLSVVPEPASLSLLGLGALGLLVRRRRGVAG